MNFVFGIDTSSTELGIGLVSDQLPVMAVSRYFRNSHAEHISQSVNFLLDANKIKASDISHAAIAVGPGSFTGLRIGIAFLKGFFFGRTASVFPVSSLESMAASWHSQKATIVCASDARNGTVFWARFEKHGQAVTRVSIDALISVNEFRNHVKDDDIVLTDTLGYGRSTAFDLLNGHAQLFPVEKFPLQRGLACAAIGAARLADKRGWTSADNLEPHYLSEAMAEKKQAVQS